jgi:hypothetical protein
MKEGHHREGDPSFREHVAVSVLARAGPHTCKERAQQCI